MTKNLLYCISLIAVGLMTSCVDKNEEVDEESKPEWLGSSIYDELANPKGDKLEGTFSTYLWLVDQLNYKEVLGRTGSKTVFPANDVAFGRFFAPGGNPWGVTKKEDLSEAQKKLLLYTSMLDNAMLVNMMSNVQDGNSIIKGVAMKHPTSISVIDSITKIAKPSDVYFNNPYFKSYDNKGINIVSDATNPMVVHFTREYMLNNSMTTSGQNSDFSVLTGQEYHEGDAFVFRNKVIHSDVTCQNGYIHQVENVITQPGNMAQMLKLGGDTKLFSRMLDRFAMPIYNSSVTRQYNDWAVQYNQATIDSIFELRYMSELSYDNRTQRDPNNNPVTSYLLPYDPGWNEYYQAKTTGSGGNGQYSDVAVMFVPTDDAVKQYFLPGGTGSFLIDQYGVAPNTENNLEANIDAIPQDKIRVLLANLMKTQLSKAVPSLFSTVTNTASDLMGLTLNDLKKSGEAYDVRIANNGVLYMLNHMIAPPEFSAVSAPATIRDDMKVVNWIIQNKSKIGNSNNPFSIGLDYYTYLLAMSANFAQFLPTDAAFGNYYINAASLDTDNPEALRFYVLSGKQDTLMAERFKYDPKTQTVGARIGEYDMKGSGGRTPDDLANIIKPIVVDMINMHTIVLRKGEQLGDRNYYVSKLGAGIKVGGRTEGSEIATSAQIGTGRPASKITKVNKADNGYSYDLDRVLEVPTQSVYKVLNTNANLSEFKDLCLGFDNTDFMKWLGISSDYDAKGMRPIDQFLVFEKPKAPGFSTKVTEDTPNPDANPANADFVQATYKDDYVVKFFSTYNYTVYAPNNTAMAAAYANGLPKWTDILAAYTDYDLNGNLPAGIADVDELKADLLKKVNLLRQFARYHFQNGTLFADLAPADDDTQKQTFMADKNNISMKLKVSVSGNQLRVTDEAGITHNIDANASGKVVNAMTRDVILDKIYNKATKIYTSSFAAVHELDQALCPSSDGRFDTMVSNQITKARRR